jgi:hypothetical protein
MKLRQNGMVSFSIKLAAFQASGGAEPLNLDPSTPSLQLNWRKLFYNNTAIFP